MIESAQRSRIRVTPTCDSTPTSWSAAHRCPCCGQRLRLSETPMGVPPGYRLEPMHAESGERSLSLFGTCQACCLMFEDVNASMATYEKVRQQVLLAVHRTRLARELFESGRSHRAAALSELASAFVCLKGQPGVRPFSAQQLQDWTCERALRADERDCAAFILHVADATSCWAQRFDVVAAMERWEPAQRAVFLEWAKAPWWA